jgi:hypothetical protein
VQNGIKLVDGVHVQEQKFALSDLFGLGVPYSASPGTIRVLSAYLRYGLERTQGFIAEKSNVTRQYVNRFSLFFRREIEQLINDAQQLGYTQNDLSNFLEYGGGSVFLSRLREFKFFRGEQIKGLLSNQFEQIVREMWEEYRVTKIYQGASPEDFEIDPPRWFCIDELGFDFAWCN